MTNEFEESWSTYGTGGEEQSSANPTLLAHTRHKPKWVPPEGQPHEGVMDHTYSSSTRQVTAQTDKITKRLAAMSTRIFESDIPMKVHVELVLNTAMFLSHEDSDEEIGRRCVIRFLQARGYHAAKEIVW